MKERVECDTCGLQITLRVDGTVGKHTYVKHGRKATCDASGKPYAKHYASIQVATRGPNGMATKWRADCRCGDVWTGPDFVEVNAAYDKHLADVAGAVVSGGDGTT